MAINTCAMNIVAITFIFACACASHDIQSQTSSVPSAGIRRSTSYPKAVFSGNTATHFTSAGGLSESFGLQELVNKNAGNTDVFGRPRLRVAQVSHRNNSFPDNSAKPLRYVSVPVPRTNKPLNETPVLKPNNVVQLQKVGSPTHENYNARTNSKLVKVPGKTGTMIVNITSGASGRNGPMPAVGTAIRNPGNKTANCNGTAHNDSSTLTSGDGGTQIEVVIIQERKRVVTDVSTTNAPAGEFEHSRRFPSSFLTPSNVTFIRAGLFQHVQSIHRYWPVYLTLALMCLCVVGICVVGCTTQGRRNMSGLPPKQYDQELPPYNYAFSYDMRTAENQPMQPA